MTLEQNDGAAISSKTAKRTGLDLRHRSDGFPLAAQAARDSFEVGARE